MDKKSLPSILDPQSSETKIRVLNESLARNGREKGLDGTKAAGNNVVSQGANQGFILAPLSGQGTPRRSFDADRTSFKPLKKSPQKLKFDRRKATRIPSHELGFDSTFPHEGVRDFPSRSSQPCMGNFHKEKRQPFRSEGVSRRPSFPSFRAERRGENLGMQERRDVPGKEKQGNFQPEEDQPLSRGSNRFHAPEDTQRREKSSGYMAQNAEEEEVLELFRKTRLDTGINFMESNKASVQCVPNNIDPCRSFIHARLNPLLDKNIERAGYTFPTLIQQYALPIISKGKDLMACAQTGSGKTAAFLVPIISDLLDNGKGRLPMHLRSQPGYRGAVPVALILAPTRELVLQIQDEARKFCFRTGFRSVLCYGGVEIHPQMVALRRGADIVVATPGRLWDLYGRKVLHFLSIRFVVLDEADRMLDLGFGEQIDEILKNTDIPDTGARQTLMFSATFPSRIQTLAKSYLANYYFVVVGRVGSTTLGITQRVEFVEPSQKVALTCRLLRKNPEVLTLIFVETKRSASELMGTLSDEGFAVAALHGDRKQHEREEALHQFRMGEITILVATDVASRGLDIPHVAHVIQFDMPSSMDDYIHRIGRTGRAGNVGLATALFEKRDTPLATELLEILKEHDQTVPEWLPDIVLQASQYKPKKNHSRARANYRR